MALPQDKLLGPVSKTPSHVLKEHLQHQVLPGGQHQGPYCKQLCLLKTKLKARWAGRACPAVTWERRRCCHMRQDQHIFKSKAENQISHWVVELSPVQLSLPGRMSVLQEQNLFSYQHHKCYYTSFSSSEGCQGSFRKRKSRKRNKCSCMSSTLFVVE